MRVKVGSKKEFYKPVFCFLTYLDMNLGSVRSLGQDV